MQSRYTKTIEGEVSHQDVFCCCAVIYYEEMRTVTKLQSEIVPDFIHLYVLATTTLSSRFLPALGINTMSLCLDQSAWDPQDRWERCV